MNTPQYKTTRSQSNSFQTHMLNGFTQDFQEIMRDTPDIVKSCNSIKSLNNFKEDRDQKNKETAQKNKEIENINKETYKEQCPLDDIDENLVESEDSFDDNNDNIIENIVERKESFKKLDENKSKIIGFSILGIVLFIVITAVILFYAFRKKDKIMFNNFNTNNNPFNGALLF